MRNKIENNSELSLMIMESILEMCGNKHKKGIKEADQETALEVPDEMVPPPTVAEPAENMIDEVKVDGCDSRINPVEKEVMDNCRKATAGTKGDMIQIGSGGAGISEAFLKNLDKIISEELEKVIQENIPYDRMSDVELKKRAAADDEWARREIVKRQKMVRKPIDLNAPPKVKIPEPKPTSAAGQATRGLKISKMEPGTVQQGQTVQRDEPAPGIRRRIREEEKQ